ncbi:sulfate transporter isoform X1 [Octopus sinensis]|uniref:Sulfate transporter isoform X1 n=1 Tax=Octopus sinensis TaxID=2607531 RepID=A0A6P7T145_9MOLL|nr:sulfate transporter isoform X1 [Octopus sinensis]XP_029644389.1 sulfate transporter isoform X1 [Octopus sinensis]XP_029644390.1 sulfate transporter isoform X1 [Octopus sinensis]XP_036364425.1 sulfate transporter isoform X1 [Octopus sinensis]
MCDSNTELNSLKVNGGVSEPNPLIEIRRPAYNIIGFREKFRKSKPPEKTFKECVAQQVRSCTSCSKERCKQILTDTFPFLRILKKYNVKTDLPNDLVSGLTVGIMQLPQGMAYALLADLPPIVGLYVSFFPLLTYFFFGTSRHAAMGTVAVVSLMIGSVVSNIESSESSTSGGALNISLTSEMNTTEQEYSVSSDAFDEVVMKKIQLAAAITFMAGIAQVIMGFLRMGVVTTYMSECLIGGFTTGAAVHVFSSQVKYVLGLKIKRFGGVFQLLFTYIEIFKNIHRTNLVELGISCICMVIIYLVKTQINQRFKDRLKIPVPIELFVVVTGTLISHYVRLKEKFGIRTVGKIPAGLPPPKVPDFVSAQGYVGDAIVIGIVAFAQSVSLASLMAKKHNYDIDSNKEMKAYGYGNIVGSFFSCYPFAASVSRTSVQDSAGGRTQVASLFSCVLVLIVIIVIGPLFRDLPNCTLSAIIMVALRTMLLQVLELKRLWRLSKYDFSIWLITFLSVVILHVDFGLGIGIIFSVFTVVIRTQRTNLKLIGKIDESEVFRPESEYQISKQYSGIKILYYNASIYFANAEIFVKQVQETSGINPEKVLKRLKKERKSLIGKDENNKSNSQMDIEKRNEHNLNVSIPINYIIVDVSGVNFVDTVGVKILKTLCADYDKIDVKVLFAGVRDPVYTMLELTDFVSEYGDRLYMTILDAIRGIDIPISTYNSEEDPKPEDNLLETMVCQKILDQ